jgi:Tfp pilus assembly protein PilV
MCARRRTKLLPTRTFSARRRGLTLTELLIASTVMTMLVGGMGTLVMAVHATNEHCRGQALGAQHARVALDRIQRAIRTAEASEQFPGCIVQSATVGGAMFPDTLVVWSPLAAAADPQGLPRVNELVVFCTDPANPLRLVELRDPTDTSTCPAVDNVAAWASLVDGLKSASSTEVVELSDRLRQARPSAGEDPRGCVRFLVLMAPSAADWQAYRAGTQTWQALSWPLDSYSSRSGMRRVVCQTELQIIPGESLAQDAALPFYGSATLNYELVR